MKACKTRNPITVVVSAAFSAAQSIFSGQLQMAYRLDNIVEMRVKSANITSADTGLTVSSGSLYHFSSSYLSSLTRENMFQVAASLDSTSSVAYGASNVLAVFGLNSSNPRSPTPVEYTNVHYEHTYKFLQPTFIQTFDWSIGNLQNTLPVQAGPYVCEFMIEFYMQCTCT